MTSITFRDDCVQCVDREKSHPPRNSLFAQIARYLQLRRQRRIDREAFEHLISLDDSILDDIGITRADVRWAAKLPLSVNASLEIQKISLMNRSSGPGLL